MNRENIIEVFKKNASNSTINAPSNMPRLRLVDAVPLDTPLTIELFPIDACNLRCEYCLRTLDKQWRYIPTIKTMPYEMYCSVIDKLAEFPNKVKLLRIAGHGEPLMHHNIDKIIRYAVDSMHIERVEIVTNAMLLDNELSDKLIEAGLHRLRISIQGTTAAAYKKHTQRGMDYDDFMKNIEYFYDRCGSTLIYIKILDYMLEDDNDAAQFIKLFKPISHALQIEHVIQSSQHIDFNVFSSAGGGYRQTGGEITNISVCPLCFYMLYIYPDGKIFPCCAPLPPFPIGDVHEKGLYDIWNGEKLHALQMKMLSVKKHGMKNNCVDCTAVKFYAQPCDILDGHEDKLLERISMKNKN